MHGFSSRDEMGVAMACVRHFEVEVAATSRFHDRTVCRRDYRSRENRKLLILLRTAAEPEQVEFVAVDDGGEQPGQQ